MSEKKEILVIGAGVSGLTSGIRLLENQFSVTIFASALPPHTTSNAAAAIWYPYRAAPVTRVLKWGRITLDVFYELMDVPESGVRVTELIELLEEPQPDPLWKDDVRSFRRATTAELPSGYKDGYFVEVPLIETPIYMQYLLTRFRQLGGQIKIETVSELSDLCQENRLIINCAGLGAKQIVPDDEVFPIRGQITRVKNSGIKQCIMDKDGPLALTYVVPRSQDCILGGTEEEHNWNLTPDAETAEAIWEKCTRLSPTLKKTDIIEHWVGLRPGRNEVKLGTENISPEKCAVIHNYGHGGAGFTLSWGCADEVVELAINTSTE